MREENVSFKKLREKGSRKLLVAVATMMVVSVVPVAVFAASDTFTDDDGSIFETDIEWLAGAGVTAGCNPPANTNFCPEDNVTRGQMAAFMRRFAEYLGAEDATVANADNAELLGGMSPTDFQPALYAFDTDSLVTVNSDTTFTIASGTVVTSSVVGCPLGTTPRADILVRASGYVTNLDVGETATLRIVANGEAEMGTSRVLADTSGAFATEWLFSTNGGTQTFDLVADEATGDVYSARNGQITVEVVRDTRCAPFVLTLNSSPDEAVSYDE